MKHKSKSLPELIALLTLGLVVAANCGAQPSYHRLTEIPITGEGGWDYVSVDPLARRLYMSHGTEVVVVDLETDKVIGKIKHPGRPRPGPGAGIGARLCQ